MKARDPGRRDAPGRKSSRNRRSPRERGRMGTSVGERTSISDDARPSSLALVAVAARVNASHPAVVIPFDRKFTHRSDAQQRVVPIPPSPSPPSPPVSASASARAVTSVTPHPLRLSRASVERGRRRDRANRRRRAGVADARVVREAELSESARGVGEERGDVRGAGGADVRGRLRARRRGRVR